MNDRAARAAQIFAIDCSEHVMTVRHDDGLYRHLAFRRPGTSFYWFDLVTWPGHLTFVGDMGSYTFARTDDMLGFFLSGSGINPTYWAEKLQGDPGGRLQVRQYSEDKFRAHVADAFREHADQHGWVLTDIADLWTAIDDDVLDQADDEQASRDALHDFAWTAEPACDDEELGVVARFDFGPDAHWDWDLIDYTYRFLYCCHAIRWGAEQYQAAQAVTA